MDRFLNGFVLAFLFLGLGGLVILWIGSLIEDLRGRGRGGGIFFTILMLIGCIGGAINVWLR